MTIKNIQPLTMIYSPTDDTLILRGYARPLRKEHACMFVNFS